jgi:uncharacterized damage-inducible protein DinB
MITIPSTREVLVARLAYIRRDLDEVVGRLTQDMMAWAPSEGARTIGGQLFEIAVVEYDAIMTLTQGREVSDAEAEAEFGDTHSKFNMVTMLTSVREETLGALESFSDAQLEESVAFARPWFGTAGLPAAPRAEIFRSIAYHEWYHVGQLVSYLWTRGDDPYKW